MNAALIESIVAASRHHQDDIATRYQLKGTDGKWYGGGGMPYGVKWTGEKSDPYYVRLTSEGTTVGKRFESQEALQADMDRMTALHDEEMRTALLAMNAKELSSQADYWLKGVTA